jgi:hypothetical protein
MSNDPQQMSCAGHNTTRRTELLCGLLLLLTVVGWSVWSWREQQQRAAYNNGNRYTARRDWDRALTAFHTAGDYADSAILAQQAETTIVGRGRLYAAAVEDADHADWLAALQNLRLLRALQPDYRDSGTRYSVAEKGVYSAALAGVVALRTAANPAGLYLRSDQTWVLLPGSDGTSSIHGFGRDGCLLYDVPTGRAGLDGTAANPNLFATSVLSVDLASETRGLMSLRVTDGVVGAATLSTPTLLDQTNTAARSTGDLDCGAASARSASSARRWHHGAGLVAYLTAGDLRVRTSDAQIDLLLEQGVQDLYDNAP